MKQQNNTTKKPLPESSPSEEGILRSIIGGLPNEDMQLPIYSDVGIHLAGS
jgi:hypothetical protein